MPKTKQAKATASKAKPAATGDEARWAAVLARDRSADGTFCYSVATTGVYCRPSCAARRAKRENVTFHDGPAAAERAGFRPCLRCKPQGPSLDERNAAKIAEACRRIESADEPPKLADLARQAGFAPFHFHRVFKEITGLTPKAYALAHRHARLRNGLNRAGTVTEAALEAGYGSSARFYAASEKVLGMSPRAFRGGGANTELKFAVGSCSLGNILVAASSIGISAILLGDDPGALIRDLEHRFPQAALVGSDREFESLMAEVIAYVERPATRFPLPLDVQGTAFQHRVWQALRDIPFGETASYTGIAEKIGKKSAVRAVAQACAANPVAIAIPCHRVVRTDGALSGYRWGIAKKRVLLDREAEQNGTARHQRKTGLEQRKP